MVDPGIIGIFFESIGIELMGLLALTLLLKDNGKVDLGLVMVWLDLQYLLIGLFSSISLTLLLVDHSKVEKSSWLSILSDRDLKVVLGFFSIFLLIVVQNTNVEICFKILWVDFKSSIVD